MKRQIPRLVIAAPGSGSGKTLAVCGILKAFLAAGKKTAAFKCGPDYIDPMFHETVLGAASKNLDTFFAGEELVRQLFLEDAREADISVIEGVMGYYDGLAGASTLASTYDVAKALEAPVILVADASKTSVSVMALLKGFLEFRKDSRIEGVIFNKLSPARYESMKKMAEEELGIKVCGYLPKMADINLESRHLGLVMPGEVRKWQDKLERLGQQCAASLDLTLLEQIAAQAPAMEEKREFLFPFAGEDFREDTFGEGGLGSDRRGKAAPVIAVARDRAFSFYYKDNLRLLEKLGAKIIPFSPLRDKEVPKEADALLLGGGYPELHGQELKENASMRNSIKQALASGMPAMAECGGFLYLQEEMEDSEGKTHKMAGFLKGKSFYTGKLSRFGYVSLTAGKDHAFGGKNEIIRGHEFHYMDTDANGEDFLAQKPITGRSWKCGVAGPSFYAGFPHLYLYSNPDWARQFVRKAVDYGKNKRK